jgi:hypothetical protein
MSATEKSKINQLAEYFAKHFNDEHFQYDTKNGDIAQYPLGTDGKRIQIMEVSDWNQGHINKFDKSFLFASLILPKYCQHDSAFEISFVIVQPPKGIGKPIKFDYVYKFHVDEFFLRLKKHLRLLNLVPSISRKRELVHFETNMINVHCFYRYNTLKNRISKCARITFKATQDFPEHFIVILDDDHKFLMAIDEMEQEFQNRYYDGIVDRKTVVRGKFLNKQEQSLIKMVYY